MFSGNARGTLEGSIDLLHDREQRAPQLGEPCPPSPAMEQRRAELIFQNLNAERERRLCNRAPFGGPGKVPLFEYRKEVSDVMGPHESLPPKVTVGVGRSPRADIAGTSVILS
jgi:hypothetical protein